MLLSVLLLLAPTARAHSAASVLVGTSTAFDANPANLRLSVRGEFGIDQGTLLGLSFLLPVTFATEGESGFGFSTRRSVFEIPLSLRGRIFPGGPIGLYADVGAGIAVGTQPFDGWFVDVSGSRSAFMTRLAMGLEVGDPDKLSFVIEPASWGTYFAEDTIRARYGLMLGISAGI